MQFFIIYPYMMFSKTANKKGFTLVEMLIVIVIIGVLAAALIPRLTSARGRANDVARKAGLQQVATALVSYNIDEGSFPDGS
jgi:general secretion pathway protein G